jgi:hypothetical protein
MHCMAYYTFLKSLRSLKEFRKNSHAKIRSKSPCTKFPSFQKKLNFKKKIEKVYYLYWTQLQFSTQPRPTSIFFPRPATSPPPLPWCASATRPPGRPSWRHAGGALPTCQGYRVHLDTCVYLRSGQAKCSLVTGLMA